MNNASNSVDDVFYRFLSNIGQESVRLSIRNGLIRVVCPNEASAINISNSYELLSDTAVGVELFIEDDGHEGVYDLVSPGGFIKSSKGVDMLNLIEQSRSRFAQQNKAILSVMTEKATVYAHKLDADQGYPSLIVLPRLGYEPVLDGGSALGLMNKPIDPNNFIGSAKAEALSRLLLGDDESVTAYYDYLWNGRLWGKQITASRWGKDEVVFITRAVPEQAHWQDTEWFERRRNDPSFQIQA